MTKNLLRSSQKQILNSTCLGAFKCENYQKIIMIIIIIVIYCYIIRGIKRKAVTWSWWQESTTDMLVTADGVLTDKPLAYGSTQALSIPVCCLYNGTVVEDACWLHPEKDSQHINLAELDAIIKGINLAIFWKMTTLHLFTDMLVTQITHIHFSMFHFSSAQS